MPLFIKESLLYKFFEKVIIKPYNNSRFKNFIGNFSIGFKTSFIYKMVDKYISKNPYFLSSISYKLFRKFIGLIDKMMDFLNGVCKKCLNGCEIYEETKKIKSLDSVKKLSLVAVLFSSFSFSYILASILLDKSNIFVFSALVFISIALNLISFNENCYKKSIIYKIFKSW